MNRCDDLKIKIFDADIGHEQHALETRIEDLTTGQSGHMIASARNGFMSTSIVDCTGTPFNYEPEYRTAGPREVIPWVALQTNISTQFEIRPLCPVHESHWEAHVHFRPSATSIGPLPRPVREDCRKRRFGR